MFGVLVNPTMTPSNIAVERVADELGFGDTFRMADVGADFERDGRTEPRVEVDDPYFGRGARRSGCLQCGQCMTGCRHTPRTRSSRTTCRAGLFGEVQRTGAWFNGRTRENAPRPRTSPKVLRTTPRSTPTTIGRKDRRKWSLVIEP